MITVSRLLSLNQAKQVSPNKPRSCPNVVTATALCLSAYLVLGLSRPRAGRQGPRSPRPPLFLGAFSQRTVHDVHDFLTTAFVPHVSHLIDFHRYPDAFLYSLSETPRTFFD
jgi:hypothetical protein